MASLQLWSYTVSLIFWIQQWFKYYFKRAFSLDCSRCITFKFNTIQTNVKVRTIKFRNGAEIQPFNLDQTHIFNFCYEVRHINCRQNSAYLVCLKIKGGLSLSIFGRYWSSKNCFLSHFFLKNLLLGPKMMALVSFANGCSVT